jgi:drug/metabolite transporter (DMT)-like permease
MTDMMRGDEIYHEEVPFTFVKYLVFVEAAMAVLFLIFFFIQISGEPIGERPAPDWVYLMLFALFVGIAALVYGIRKMTIGITPQAVNIYFGFFSRTIPFESVVSVSMDSGPGIKYGGWGVRVFRDKKGWVLAYNTFGRPRVVLGLRRGRYGRLVFSTRNPDEVISIVERYKSG